MAGEVLGVGSTLILSLVHDKVIEPPKLARHAVGTKGTDIFFDGASQVPFVLGKNVQMNVEVCDNYDFVGSKITRQANNVLVVR